jgi:hypothetical protein
MPTADEKGQFDATSDIMSAPVRNGKNFRTTSKADKVNIVTIPQASATL